MSDESETARAVREARASLCDVINDTDRQRGDLARAIGAHDSAIRADERAVLARAVSPLTMTAVYEQEVRGELKREPPVPHVEALLDELDRTRAALTARDAEIATLREERDAAIRAREELFDCSERHLTNRNKAEAREDDVRREAAEMEASLRDALSREREAHARLVEAAERVASIDCVMMRLAGKHCGQCTQCLMKSALAALRGAP